jgi:CRP/FNR family transcriptional regulator, cyclic AMP receptor protein
MRARISPQGPSAFSRSRSRHVDCVIPERKQATGGWSMVQTDMQMAQVAARRVPYSAIAETRPRSSVEAARSLIGGDSVLGRLLEPDLVDLLQWSMVRTLRKRAQIYRRGDPGRTVIVILDGYVKLSSMTVGGREVVLEIARPGMCFGELSVLNDWPRDTDATALSRCRLLAIDGRQFTQIMARSPEALQTVIQLISRRLRTATERVLDGVAMVASARLAKALIQLAELQCSAVGDGARIDLQLSQTELGGMTGLTRESINKHLASLRDAGWISLSGKAVTLLDCAALHRLIREHDGEPSAQGNDLWHSG